MNPSEYIELQTQANELLQKGFIRDSLSLCAVHVLLTLKKDSFYRMCVDTKATNKVIIK
jgi:hypothetical protein